MSNMKVQIKHLNEELQRRQTPEVDQQIVNDENGAMKELVADERSQNEITEFEQGVSSDQDIIKQCFDQSNLSQSNTSSSLQLFSNREALIRFMTMSRNDKVKELEIELEEQKRQIEELNSELNFVKSEKLQLEAAAATKATEDENVQKIEIIQLKQDLNAKSTTIELLVAEKSEMQVVNQQLVIQNQALSSQKQSLEVHWLSVASIKKL